MSDIRLSVDVTSLVDARKKMEDFQKSVSSFTITRLASGINSLQNNIRSLVEAQQAGTIGASAYQKGLLEMKRAYEQLGYSSQAATAAVRRYADQIRSQAAAAAAARAAQELAAANQRAAQSYNNLRASMDPVFASQQRMKQAHDTIRAALAAGIITRAQAAQSLLQYRNALRNATLAGNQHTLGLNRTAVLTQQAGYQFGDFFVQLQSGTNIMVAFGQQATQLIGTMAAMSTSLRNIAIFSGLGVLVAVGTAIGAYFMRASGASDTLAQKLQKLQEAGNKLSSTFDSLTSMEFEETFGRYTNSIRSMNQAMLALDEAAQLRELVGSLDRLEKSADANVFAKFFKGMAAGLTFDLVGANEELADEQAYRSLGFDMGREQYIGYVEGIKASAKSGNTQEVVDLFADFMNEAGDEVTAKGYALADTMRQIALSIARTSADMSGPSGSEAIQALDNLISIFSSSADSARNSVKNLASEYGKMSLEAKEALTNIQNVQSVRVMDELRASVELLGSDFRIVGDTLEQQVQSARKFSTELLNTYGTVEDMPTPMQNVFELVNKWVERAARFDGIVNDSEGTTNRLEDAAARVRDRIQEAVDAVMALQRGLADSMQALQVQEAGIAAAQRVIAAGGGERSARAAQAIAEAGSQTELELSSLGVSGPELQAAVAQAQEAERRRQENLARENDLFSVFSDTGGGGATTTQKDPLEELRQRIKLETELLGKTEAQQEMIRALGVDYSKYTQDQLANVESMIEALMREQEQREKIANLQETLANSATDLFFAAAKSTDAFKQSLASMLQTLAQAIAQQAFLNALQNTSGGAGVTGFFGKIANMVLNADGNAFERGNVMAFAAGGVVSQPNFFPMAGGKTGLMGEAGPEAIMPLKRGKDGKLGVAAEGGGGTTVVQPVINIDARGAQQGVAEQINAQIAQSLPTIIEATMSATRERSRRGAM